MTRKIGIGKQDFERVRQNHNFYIDKTHFIKEWWERDDDVTLIARPRRFGKTLNMSMVEKFFSLEYADMEDYAAADSLNALSRYLMKYYGKKVIILLDEYDTPMQEAYVNGYWKDMVSRL